MRESSGYKEYVAGLVAGVATVAIGHPFDTVKVKLQKHNTEAHGIRYKSGLQCAARILATEGVRGLYTGATPSFVGVAFESSLLFGIYSQTKQSLQKKGGAQSSRPQPQLKDSSLDRSYLTDMGIGILSGGLGGVAFWSAVLPLDVAKTIIQTTSDKSSSRNPFQILQSIHRRAGLKGCYAGLGPTILRAFPANAAAIVTWELAMKLMGIKHH